ncbi:MAG: hypothetical protein ING69_10565 [Rhodocyclaceae bacterium]|nr:hypothetical protein [Rhodocyclaceae bacterium]
MNKKLILAGFAGILGLAVIVSAIGSGKTDVAAVEKVETDAQRRARIQAAIDAEFKEGIARTQRAGEDRNNITGPQRGVQQ